MFLHAELGAGQVLIAARVIAVRGVAWLENLAGVRFELFVTLGVFHII